MARFNANVSYSGLVHAVTQEHLFAENKEKLIHSALMALINKDIPHDDVQGKKLAGKAHAQQLTLFSVV